MNLGELRDEARHRLRDTRQPYGWTDADLDAYANRAVVEACDRARLIYDTTTAELTNLVLVEGVRDYYLSPLIKHVDQLFIDLPGTDKHQLIGACDKQDLQNWFGAGWDMQPGTPQRFWRDSTGVHYYPIPDQAYTGKMWVYRLPLDTERMTTDTDEPPFDADHHWYLLHWMCYEAYSVHDADLGDPKKAAQALADFEAYFGRKPSAKLQRWAVEGAVGQRAYSQRFGGT